MGTVQLPNLAWIVCHGRTLLVVDELVDCPLRGRVEPDLCVSCHYLETVDAERDARLGCDAGVARISAERWRETEADEHEVVADLIGAF